LSDRAIKAAKPRLKPYRLYDQRGLYLEVSPNGGRWWRLKYRHGGKEKRLSLGTYPETGLAEARQRCDDARQLLKNNLDPSAQRRAERGALKKAVGDSFEAIAREWFEIQKGSWAASHCEIVESRLDRHIFPKLGKLPITSIAGADVVWLIKEIAKRSPETARRVLSIIGRVFRYAMSSHRATTDPTHKMVEILPATTKTHFPSITAPKAVGALLRAIDGYEGTFTVKCALQLAPLLFVRPGELRQAEWSEFNLDAGEWLIPAVKMKGKRDHLVPLSKPAVALLLELQALTGRGRFVFPSIRTPSRPMSENTMNAALRRLGYEKEEMVAHGFRSMASTLLHELGYPSQFIEAQLAHAEKNQVKAAYNKAKYLPERRKMMQEWAKYLDGLRSGAEVVPIHGGKRA